MTLVEQSATELLFKIISRAEAGPAGGLVVVEWDQPDGHFRTLYPSSEAERFGRVVPVVAESYETRLRLSSARDASMERWHHCRVIWCVVESSASAVALARFKPRPTLVLGEGRTVRQTALWALSRPLGWELAVRANRRLAHRMRGPKRYVEPDHAIRVPGSLVCDGRVRPIRVEVREMNPDAVYLPAEVVRWLRDPPDPNGWRRTEAS